MLTSVIWRNTLAEKKEYDVERDVWENIRYTFNEKEQKIEEEQLAVVVGDDRLKLVYVAHKQQLLAAERLALVAAVDAQHFVYEVYDVGPYHAYLDDDDKLDFAQELAVVGIVFQGLADVVLVIATVGRYERVERKAEEAMQGAASRINGGYACGSQYHELLLCGLGHIA